MPRYVILRHTLPAESTRPSHWDFMLEFGDVLRTWALEQSPDGAEPQPAQLLPDHRAAYLTYEGPVSGNRGEVARWDEGTFTTADDLAGERIEVALSGRRLNGRVVLTKQSSSSSGAEGTFEFRYLAGR